MAEFEELRITVSLDNKATAGFTDFKKSVAEFTTGQPAQHLENFKRHNTLLTQLLKATGTEATGTSKAFIDLSSKFTAGASAIGAVGYALFKTTAIVAEAAKGIADQANKLKSFGVPYAEGKNIIEQYELVNISANKTLEDIQAANQLQFEARKVHHSEMFDQLRQLVFNDPYVNEFKTQLQNARTQAELQNVIIEGQAKFSELSNKYYHSDDEATQKRTNAQIAARFRAIVGLNEEFDRATRVKELDQDRAKALEKLNTEAQKFTRLWNETAVNFERIGSVLEGRGIQSLTPLLTQVRDMTQAIFDVMTKGMDAFKDRKFWETGLGSIMDPFKEGGRGIQDPMLYRTILGPEIYDGLKKAIESDIIKEMTPRAGVPPPVGEGAPLMSNYNIDGGDKLGENTRELKRLNDNLYQLLHPELMQGVGPAARAAMDSSASATSAPAGGSSPGLSFGGIHIGGAGLNFGGITHSLSTILPGLNIPQLAQGGIVVKPTVALIGEHGPEAVVPLHSPSSGGSAGAGMGGSSTSIRAFQFGGIVHKPTLALIGEAGPEAIVPLRSQQPSAGGSSFFMGGGFMGGFGAGDGAPSPYYRGSAASASNVIPMPGARGVDGASASYGARGADGADGAAAMAGAGARSALFGRSSRFAFADGSSSAFAFHSHLGAIRDVIDGAAREQQNIEAAGHIKVQVGNDAAGGPTVSETLFKPVPEQSLVQMTPAHKGIAERSRSAPPTFAAG